MRRITLQRPGTAVLLALFTLLSAAAMPAGAADEAASYTLSKQYGSVLFRVLFQETLYMVGRFDDYSGSLTLDPADLSSARLQATVNMASLNMPDSDVAETLVNSSAWFNASLYPRATFTTRSAEVTGEREVDLVGELSFMGMSRPWTLHARLFGGTDGELSGSSVGLHATGTFQRTDFGLDQYMNMAADPVEIEVNVKFNRD